MQTPKVWMRGKLATDSEFLSFFYAFAVWDAEDFNFELLISFLL